MTKKEFETAVGKCINEPTYLFYLKLYEVSGIQDVYEFVFLLNKKAIKEDVELKKRRKIAEKELPILKAELSTLKIKRKSYKKTLEEKDTPEALRDYIRREWVSTLQRLREVKAKINLLEQDL